MTVGVFNVSAEWPVRSPCLDLKRIRFLLLEPPWFTLSLLSTPHGGYRVGKAAGRSPGLSGESPRLPQAPC